VPQGVDSTYILGGQGNLWTEQIPSAPQVEYMTYPRAFALSEVYWSPKAKKDWNGFVRRVEDHFGRFDHAQLNYARSMYDPIIT
jgi:hexosaminidase